MVIGFSKDSAALSSPLSLLGEADIGSVRLYEESGAASSIIAASWDAIRFLHRPFGSQDSELWCVVDYATSNKSISNQMTRIL